MSFRVFTGRTTDNGQVFFPTFKLLEEGPSLERSKIDLLHVATIKTVLF
jgi:hypothetical protein